jgi:hypothetical protein
MAPGEGSHRGRCPIELLSRSRVDIVPPPKQVPGEIVEAAGTPEPNPTGNNGIELEAAGPEIPEGDREARLLRSQHTGGVPELEAAGPEPL